MAKLTLQDLGSLTNEATAITLINANSALIEGALENTLSRDGTVPNTMSSSLDMNSNRIINLGSAIANTDAATLGDLLSMVTASGTAISAAGADRKLQYNNNGVLAGASALTYSTEGYLGVNNATPGANAATSYPFSPVWGGLDVAGRILLHPEQNAIYVYGEFGSTAYFADTTANSWGWAPGLIENLGNCFGLLYTTGAFVTNTHQAAVWAPNWQYLFNPLTAAGVDPDTFFTGGLAVGWSHTVNGATNLVNSTAGAGNTDFIISDWNSNTSTMTDLILISKTGNTVEIHSPVAAAVPLVVIGATSQSGNLQNWKNSTGSILSYIDKDGTMSLASGLLAFGVDPATGIQADTTNISLRTYASSAKIYFQNASGVTTFGDWDSTRLNVTNHILINSGIMIKAGSGAPSLTAAKGSLYLRTDGSSVSTRAYINTDGSTTWTAITTAA